VNEFWKFFLLGLGSGAIYALVALGIVLVYRGSGVVNFAHGVFALTGAGVFTEVRDSLGTAGAVALGIVAGATAGAIVNLVVMTPLRRSSPLVRIIATLGVLALGRELWKHRLGEIGFRTVEQFLPSKAVEPFGGGIIIGEDRIWIFGITVALTVVLTVAYRKTRFGLATSAVAENEAVAAAQGWSPALIATVNWALGGALAGFAGILLAGVIGGLSIDSPVLVVVIALAAALVGNFSSFPLTLFGGLLVGVLESEALHYGNPTGYLKGLSTAVPFLVIVALLIVRGRALPLRSFLADRLPSIGTGRVRPLPIVLLAGVVIGSLWLFTTDWVNAVITSGTFAFLALSLVVVTGYAGQLSLAQWSIAGIGALLVGRYAADLWSMPFLLALAVGMVLTVPVGMVVALPAVRVRGVNLAVTTFALSLVLSTMVLSNDIYTGGLLHPANVPAPEIFGWKIDALTHPARYGVVIVVLLAVAALLVANLRRGPAGRRLIAVRDNERAAASLGISIVGAKLYAFSLASALAGAGGGLIAFRNPRLNLAAFDFFGNIQAVLLATIGGIGWIGGALIAGTIQIAGTTEHVLTQVVSTESWYPVIAATLLLLTVVFNPDGIASELQRRGRVVAGRLRRPARRLAPIPAVTDRRQVTRVAPKSLELTGLTVRFGNVVALDGVDLRVDPGEVVGLIGPNGAGKTTLIEAATGFVRASGSVSLDRRALARLSPRRRAALGVTRSFQSLELFDDLTVLDNLRVAADDGNRLRYLRDLVWPTPPPLPAAALAAIDEFGLGAVLDQKPGDLPYAQRRTIAIARAVASCPSVLLLDEPAAGLDDWATEELARLVRRLADDWGMAVLLVEHDVGMVMRTCDRVVALDFGRVIGQGTPAEIRTDPVVVASYLGSSDVGGQLEEPVEERGARA
jgi:sulfate-transporting ATPase